MSYRAQAWALKQRTESPSAQFLLHMLAYHHNEETGRCDPGIEHLAEITRMNRRTVIRQLDYLESIGLIKIIRRGGSGSGRKSNQHELNIDGQLGLFSAENGANAPVDNLGTNRGNVTSDHQQSDNLSLRGNVTPGHGLSDIVSRQCDTRPPEQERNSNLTGKEGKPENAPPVDNFASGSTDRWLQWIRHLSLNRLKAHQHEATRQAFVSLTEDQQKRCLDYSMGGNASGKLYPRLYPDRFRNDADLKTQGHKPSNPGRESNVTAQRLRQKAKDGDPQAIQALEQMGMAL